MGSALRTLGDEMVAMDLGAVICRGTPDEVLADPRVIESYLGTDPSAIQRSGTATPSNGTAAPKAPAERPRRPRPLVATDVR